MLNHHMGHLTLLAPCFLRKYPEITSYEQRCSYKEDFTRGYLEYTAIKERSDLVSQEFSALKERLKNLPEDSEAAKVGDVRCYIIT